MSTRSKYRRVIIEEEYLDGVQGIAVRKPAEYDEHAIAVDADLLDRMEKARNTLALIQDDLRGLMLNGRRVANPKFKREALES